VFNRRVLLSSSPSRAQRGLSLIETLVTIVVISVGMLGIAALYVESLKAGQTAVLRTRAVALAADMADRIRTNQAGGPTYDVGPDAVGVVPPNACADSAAAPAVNCGPDEMALHDIWQWKTLVGNTVDEQFQRLGLPNATARIDRSAATVPVTYTITISWAEKDEPLSYSISVAI
jgi:type IV pilus assembly protein PilV